MHIQCCPSAHNTYCKSNVISLISTVLCQHVRATPSVEITLTPPALRECKQYPLLCTSYPNTLSFTSSPNTSPYSSLTKSHSRLSFSSKPFHHHTLTCSSSTFRDCVHHLSTHQHASTPSTPSVNMCALKQRLSSVHC